MFNFRKFILLLSVFTSCPVPVSSYKSIVLTGGPCAGKTSSIKEIKNKLEGIQGRSKKYKVFILEEIATSLIGADVPNLIKNCASNIKIIVDRVMDITFGKPNNKNLSNNVKILNKTKALKRMRTFNGIEPCEKEKFKKEIANIISNNQIDDKYKFQWLIFAIQLKKENELIQKSLEIEKSNPNIECIILCDRGLLDGLAYVPKEESDKMLKTYDFDFEFKKIYDRYNFVIHLQSFAADESLYTKRKEDRTEDAKSAKELDEKIYNLWKNHANFIRIGDIEEKFEKRVDMLFEKIENAVKYTRSNLSKKRDFSTI